jgi:hypothetical protein
VGGLRLRRKQSCASCPSMACCTPWHGLLHMHTSSIPVQRRCPSRAICAASVCSQAGEPSHRADAPTVQARSSASSQAMAATQYMATTTCAAHARKQQQPTAPVLPAIRYRDIAAENEDRAMSAERRLGLAEARLTKAEGSYKDAVADFRAAQKALAALQQANEQLTGKLREAEGAAEAARQQQEVGARDAGRRAGGALLL